MQLLENALDSRITVVCADTGGKGISLCRTFKPRCVLLQVHLPDMTALEFLSALRTGIKASPVAVVVIADDDDEGIAMEAQKWGTQDYVLESTLTAGQLQRAINNGDVLLGMQLHRLEDIEQDACLEVRFQRLDGRPTIGALGLIEPGQTFDPDLEAPTSSVDDAIIEGGVLLAGPFELSLPMQIGNNQLLVTIFDAQIEARVHEDGSIEGMMAGAIEVA